MTTPDTLSDFVDFLSAAAHGAAAESVHALAEDALSRGLLDASAEAVVAHVSVADCTSRLLATERARVYDKVRRTGMALMTAVSSASSSLGLPTPAVHMRLRHSASLLAGHGPDAWTHLMHSLEAAAKDAGISSVTGPLVAWNLLPVCDLLPHVLGSTPHVVFRADLGDAPHPDDVLGLALALLMTQAAAPAVLSAGAAACPAMDPDHVDIHSRVSIPILSTDDPALVSAVSRSLAETGNELARRITTGKHTWHPANTHLDVLPAQFGVLPAAPDLVWTNAGWPVTRPGSNRILPGASPEARTLAERVSSMLSAVSSPGARYAVVELS